VLEKDPGCIVKEHCTDESVRLELKRKRNFMVRVAQLKLQYFGHVVRGSAGELALVVMEGTMDGTRPRAATKNSSRITVRNGVVKPNKNARCWRKIGTVGERCPGSGHYLSRNHIRGTYRNKMRI